MSTGGYKEGSFMILTSVFDKIASNVKAWHSVAQTALCDPMDCNLWAPSIHRISQNKNTGVSCRSSSRSSNQDRSCLCLLH